MAASPRLWEITGKGLCLLACAGVLFGAGRLWSLREVNEARRQAGLAEQERIALQAELARCRNAQHLGR
jgi:hypothetical protein